MSDKIENILPLNMVKCHKSTTDKTLYTKKHKYTK